MIASPAIKKSTGPDTFARCSRITVKGIKSSNQFIGLRRKLLNGLCGNGEATSLNSDIA
jgi:hypothetical protein